MHHHPLQEKIPALVHGAWLQYALCSRGWDLGLTCNDFFEGSTAGDHRQHVLNVRHHDLGHKNSVKSLLSNTELASG